MKEKKIKTVESTNIFGDVMWPIILFLKISGHSPLTYERTSISTHSIHNFETNDNSKSNKSAAARTSNPRNGPSFIVSAKRYKIKIRSFFFIWSVLSAVFILYRWLDTIYLTLNQSYNISGSVSAYNVEPENPVDSQIDQPLYTPLVLNILLTIVIGLSTIQATQVLLASAEAKPMAKLLNDWTDIQREFQSTFPSFEGPTTAMMGGLTQKLKRIRNLLFLIVVAIPTGIFLPTYLILTGTTGFNLLLTFPYGWDTSAVSLMEDVKVIMICRTLAEGFAKIREGISHSIKTETVSPAKIKSWRRLVHRMRRHVRDAGECQKSHQLFLIAGTLLMITTNVFMLIRAPTDPDNKYLFRLVGLGYVLVIMGRLYLKILSSNSITQNELLIANDLVLMETEKYDPGIQLEVAFLHDMIVQNPSVITFGNYVVLNKSFLLGVASQVVTYLIVLMQFTN